MGVGKARVPEEYFDSERSGIPEVVVPLKGGEQLKIELSSK
jgi:hypothetical protein